MKKAPTAGFLCPPASQQSAGKPSVNRAPVTLQASGRPPRLSLGIEVGVDTSSGFLNLSTIDISGQVTFAVWGCPYLGCLPPTGYNSTPGHSHRAPDLPVPWRTSITEYFL